MYKIGELAKLCDIKTDTLRFYEKTGLLRPSERTQSGYRLYSEQDKAALKFILQAKKLGFNLSEINDLLMIDIQKEQNSCSDVKDFIDAKIIDVQEKIDELTRFKQSLSKLSQACCGSAQSAGDCTILQALETDIENIKPEHHH